jgi:hypothetical protein
MGQRKPRANWQTTQLKNNNLSDQALAVVNGLLAAIATFPTPPVPSATLGAQLNNYNTALAASIGGSKQQRKEMATQRQLLRGMLVDDGQYVNQIVWSNIVGGQSYVDASNDIVSSGYILGAQPSPIGPLPEPAIKKFGSYKIGQLSVLIRPKIKGAKAYQIILGLHGTNQDTWTSYTFPNGNMTIDGLTSALNMDGRVTAIGTSPVRNYTAVFSQVIT